MKFKRRFDGFLSEEHIKQQFLSLVCFLLASFLIFWGISAISFPDDYNWKQILALYFDPGVFDSYKDNHTWFPLIITTVGIFVFTALLITVFINVFSNISSAYKKGERRYKGITGHTLILGANRMLIGMLAELKKDGSTNDILIMTSKPVEELRDRVEAYFGDKKFMKRLTFYFDERDNTSNLNDARAKYAKEIYIIGEDGEVDHNSVSISCCEKLEKICKDSTSPVHCFLVLDNQSSAEIYHYHTGKFSQGTKLRVDIIDIKEYVAEQTLLGMNGEGQLPIDGKGIKPDTLQYLHFIVSGLTPMAKAMALTAAYLCHFPNFNSKTGTCKTVITFIDHDIKRKRDIFVSEHQNLFMLSHYEDISFDSDGKKQVKNHKPEEAYGDFLDIAWEFVDADISSPEAKRYIDEVASDTGQQLAIAICQESQVDNMSAALHLPAGVYDGEKNIPIYVHLWEQGDAITKANATGQFGNIYCFGTGTSADKDPLFKKRLKRGQRVNFVYNSLYAKSEQSSRPSQSEIENEWYKNIESNKFSSIYCANSIPVKIRSFGDSIYSARNMQLCETEHRRWVLTELLLGFKPYTQNYITELRESVANDIQKYNQEHDGKSGTKENSPAWNKAWGERKITFQHVDIVAFSDLIDKREQEKDIALMVNIPFILSETNKIKQLWKTQNVPKL